MEPKQLRHRGSFPSSPGQTPIFRNQWLQRNNSFHSLVVRHRRPKTHTPFNTYKNKNSFGFCITFHSAAAQTRNKMLSSKTRGTNPVCSVQTFPLKCGWPHENKTFWSYEGAWVSSKKKTCHSFSLVSFRTVTDV